MAVVAVNQILPPPPQTDDLSIPEQSFGDETSCYQADEDICLLEATIAEKINTARQVEGLSPLILNHRVSFAARKWSEEQSKQGQLSHDGFPRDRLAQIKEEFGSQPQFLFAENVALISAFSGEPDRVSDEIVNGWLGSPGHRRNILSQSNATGIGVFRSGNVYFATQIFY
ncbi:MAG: CAP domain-containing protein [Pseudobacteriovorax sp.]|nr:CAP domain-containing protein [Pseudobacteriovorax sp.]